MTTTQAFADRVARVPCAACGAAVDVADFEPLSAITCPNCRSQIIVPGVVGSLVLKNLLGRGTAGIVYEAFDYELHKDVAVKVFLKAASTDGAPGGVDIIEKCLTEARAMRALSHPNIVQIYKVAQKGERPFIVMELLTGDRLDKVIAEHWLVEEPRALRMAIDIASGLKAVHDAGFAHLDVKPANIQMDGRGVCKLLDYDTARSLRQIEEQGAGLVGTPYYVAPEIIRRGSVDFRADMYSLGATLFHLIAQRPPFQGETSRDVVQERLKRRAMNLREVRPDVSVETGVIIGKMLEPQPQDRYPDYDLLLADLRAAEERAAGRARLAAPGAAAGGPRKPMPHSAVAAVAVVAVAVIAFFISWATRPADETQGDQRIARNTDNGGAGAGGNDADGKDRVAPAAKVNEDDPVEKDKSGQHVDPPVKPIPDVPVQPVKPVPQPDPVKDDAKKQPDPPKPPPPPPEVAALKRDEKEVDGWIAGKGVTLTFKPGLLTLWGTGGAGSEPSIRIAGIKGPGNSPEPSILEIRVKASGEGQGRVWWLSEKFPLFSDSRIKPFDLKHDSEWREYIIPIHAKGNSLEFRLDFGAAAGIFEVAWIKFYANGASDIRPTQQWRFEER